MNKVTKYEYNVKGQLIKETDAKGKVTSYSYDKNGNQEKVTNALGAITSYTYDAKNQLLEEKDAKGNVISYKYDALGNLINKTDARGNRTYYEYDSSNNLTKVTDALGHVTNYTYDKLGNLIEETRVGLSSSNDQTTKYEYDKNGRLTKLTDPLGESISYVYNGNGQITKETQKDGTTTGYQYDKVGNVKKITYSDNRSVTYTYDSINQLKSMKDWNGTTTYEYDANGQTVKITDPKNQVIKYTWTKLGQKKSITYPNGEVVSYVYDNNGNLSRVTDTNNAVTTYTYDALNQVKTRKLPNSAESAYTYDSIGQLTERKEKNGGVLKDTYTYEYDKNGNRIKETKVSSGMTEITHYTYDVLNQLTDVTDKNGTRTYGFDEFNNRITKEESGKLSTQYIYNNLNQLVYEFKGGDLTTYSYDKRGNLSTVEENGSTKQVYTFDSTNKLTKVVGEDSTTVYSYDGDGNRVNAKVTKNGSVISNTSYAVDTMTTYQNIIMAKDTVTAKVSAFTFGNEQVSVETDGKISYYRNDEKNSVTEILDETGKVQASIQYDEYGVILNPEVVGTNGNIFAYTGHVYDESTGLYYAKARYYDAKIGRFISEDSYRGEQGESTSLNLYAYVMNNPIKYTDPSGKIVAEATILIIYGIGAIYVATYAYLNTPAGKEAIRNGAVAIHKGRVIAGNIVLGYYYLILIKTLYEINWVGDKIGNIYDRVTGTKKIVNAPSHSKLYTFTNIDRTTSILQSKKASKSIIVERRLQNKAIAARDAQLADIATLSRTQRSKYTTVAAGYNRETGRVAVAAKLSENYIGQNVCVEDLVVAQLGGTSQIKNIVMTPAIRPRTGEIIPVCKKCQTKYTRDNFIPGTPFQ